MRERYGQIQQTTRSAFSTAGKVYRFFGGANLLFFGLTGGYLFTW